MGALEVEGTGLAHFGGTRCMMPELIRYPLAYLATIPSFGYGGSFLIPPGVLGVRLLGLGLGGLLGQQPVP